MAAPFLRVGRLSEQRLRLESSFGMVRGRPSVMDFSTKSGNPKKPVRYTSIKKAKPKTIIDVGKLILQKANDTKSSKQSVIAEAALKAATQTAKHPALKQSSVLGNSCATTVTIPNVATVAANSSCDSLENVKPKVSDARNPIATSSSTSEDLFDAAASGEQGNVPINIDGEKVPAPAPTQNLATEASSASEFSSFVMSFEGRTIDPNHVPDEMASSPEATPETNPGAVPVPIDVTYSEEDTSSDYASTEPSIGVLSATGTVNTEMVGAIDIPVTPEVLIPTMSPAGHDFAKPTQVPEGVEIFRALEGSASTPSLTSEVAPSVVEVSRTQIQEGGQLQTSQPLADLGYVASSKTFVEEGTVASESFLGVQKVPDSVLEPAVAQPGVPHGNIVVEQTGPRKMSTSYPASEKAIISDSSSRIVPVERANQQTTKEIHEDLRSQAEDEFSVAKEFMDQDLDPTNGELADQERKTEGGKSVRESEAHLDPIKRLFLDKIREYSTKSKAHDGLVDASPEYEKAFSKELAKLQRLYGNGDLTEFPEFQFPEPVLDEINPK